MSEIKEQTERMNLIVGNNIRLLRKTQSMTQQQLGETIGVTFQQIQKYEKGTNQVSASRLKALSEIFNVPIAYFFTDRLEPISPQQETTGFCEDQPRQIEPSQLAIEGNKLIQEFKKIKDPNIRQQLIGLVASLAKTSQQTDTPPKSE